jgi:hypothetical protein
MQAKKWAEAIADYEAALNCGELSKAQLRNYGVALAQRGVELDMAGDLVAAEK